MWIRDSCIWFSTLNCLMNTSVKLAPNNPLDWHRYDLVGVSKPLTTFELIDMIQTACNEFCIRFAVEQTLETDQKEILDYIAAHGLDLSLIHIYFPPSLPVSGFRPNPGNRTAHTAGLSVPA